MYYIDKKILKRKKGGNHVNKDLKRKSEDCKEGLPGDGVHKELEAEIMTLTEKEVGIVTYLLASSRTLPLQGQLVQCHHLNL